MLRAFALAAGALLAAQSASAAQSDAPAGEVERERGRYLVHRVAMCVQCHSPRDAEGGLIEGRLLEGGTIPVDSPYASQAWAFQAPRLAGLPGWEIEDFVSLLVTGRRRNGRSPRPPMPPFRLVESDARAIASYLRSLGTARSSTARSAPTRQERERKN